MQDWSNSHAIRWYNKNLSLIPRLKDEVRLKKMISFCLVIDVFFGGKKSLAPLEAMILSLCCGKFTIEEIVGVCSDALGFPLEESIKLVGKTLVEQNAFLKIELHRIMTDNRFDPKDYIYIPKPIPKGRVEPYETPLDIVLAITNNCNLRCIYCYRAAGNALRNELTTSEIFDILDQVSALKIVRIFLTGGEPLIRPDFVDIVRAVIRHNIHPYISTNGVLANESLVKSLKEAGLPIIQVSLDAVTQKNFELLAGTPERLDLVKAAIQLFVKHGIKVTVKSVITKINWREAAGIIKFCADSGVSRISLEGFGISYGGRGGLDLCINEGEAVQLSATVERLRTEYAGKMEVEGFKQAKHWEKREDIIACGGLISSFVIQPNGDVALCENLGNVDSLVFGNVREKKIAKIWGNKKIMKFLNPKREEVEPMCFECSEFRACRTGCYNRQLAGSGKLYTPDPFCWKCQGEKVTGLPC